MNIYYDYTADYKIKISYYSPGVIGRRSIQKTVSASLFLYFACLMPSIAFGVLNEENTKGALGKLNVR